MVINRSGYYKWLQRKGASNRYIQDREYLTDLLIKMHKQHKVFGYHALSEAIRQETGWKFSDNLAHKCCKAAGIRSKAKNYKYRKAGKESIIYPNIIRRNWSAQKPLEIIVSDMTCIRSNGKMYE